MQWRDNLGSAAQSRRRGMSWTPARGPAEPFARPARAHPPPPLPPGGDSAARAREEALEDRRLEGLARMLAGEAAADEARLGGSEVAQAVRRFQHVAFALRRAVDAGAGALRPPPPLELAEVLALPAAQLGAASELGPLLRELRGGGDMSLRRDFALSDADLSDVAEAAEVDENTLSGIIRLKQADLLDMLRRS